MAALRLFAAARIAAGTARDDLPGATVGEILDLAVERYGREFADTLRSCAIWCNGEVTDRSTPIGPDDEIAVLPPVSGGS